MLRGDSLQPDSIVASTRDCELWIFGLPSFIKGYPLMASIDQIQVLLTKENQKLKTDLGAEIMKQVGVLLDTRLEAHEAKIMNEIRALQERTKALEAKGSNEEGVVTGAVAAKRARSEPRTAPGKHELKPVVVLTGFPFNSRKKELEEFVRNRLAEQEEWRNLIAFAPSVRSSVVMVKMRSRDEVFEFIRSWKESSIRFKDRDIRARADKTPEQRTANSKIYKMAEHLKGVMIDKDVDPDFKNSSVWVGEGEVVKWVPQEERFSWSKDGISKAGVTIDHAEAERCVTQS